MCEESLASFSVCSVVFCIRADLPLKKRYIKMLSREIKNTPNNDLRGLFKLFSFFNSLNN